MDSEKKQAIIQSLTGTFTSLRAALNGAYKLAPFTVLVLLFLSWAIVWLIVQWSPLMTGTAVLIILAVSVVIFIARNNFGEALLSLVGGLLSIFAYEWTLERYVAFSVAWIGFALSALLIASLKVAAKNEEIYLQAAMRLVSSAEEMKEMAKVLEKIGQPTSPMPMLGPIERAEIIRTFAFRNLDPKLFSEGLRATENLSVITKCGTNTISIFVSDFFQSLIPADGLEATGITDELFCFIQETPVPPEEFFAAFENSRRLLVSRAITPTEYLDELHKCLSEGVSVDAIYQEIKNRLKKVE